MSKISTLNKQVSKYILRPVGARCLNCLRRKSQHGKMKGCKDPGGCWVGIRGLGMNPWLIDAYTTVGMEIVTDVGVCT